MAAPPPAASTDPRKAAAMRCGTTFGWAGLTLVVLGVLLILLLHVLPPSSQVNPVTKTISEYALGANRWIFDLALFALATGTVGVLVGLVRARVTRAFGAASLLVLTWAVCLVLLVVFQKYDYAADSGVGLGGRIHRMATLVGFLSLPVGALLVSGGDGPEARRARRWTRTTSVVALLSFGPLCWAVAQGLLTGVAWWGVFPLGAVERVMALTEMAVLATLGWWAVAAGRADRRGAGSAGLPADPARDSLGGTPLVQ